MMMMTSSEVVASIFGQFEDFLRNVGRMDIFETLVYNYRLKPVICGLTPEFTHLFVQLLDRLTELKNNLYSWNTFDPFEVLMSSESYPKITPVPPGSHDQSIPELVLNAFVNHQQESYTQTNNNFLLNSDDIRDISLETVFIPAIPNATVLCNNNNSDQNLSHQMPHRNEENRVGRRESQIVCVPQNHENPVNHVPQNENEIIHAPQIEKELEELPQNEENQLLIHIAHPNEENQIRKNKFLCQLCGKKYATSQSLNAHLNCHTKLKKFPCQFCSKIFTRKDKKIFHESTHTGLKSFICEICGKSFCRKTKLDDHLRRHSGVKKYKCAKCNKSYASHRDLRNHSAKHEDAKDDAVPATFPQSGASSGMEPGTAAAATTEYDVLSNEVTEIFKLNWPELPAPSSSEQFEESFGPNMHF